MTVTEIEADVIYNHERLGHVLVTGIAQFHDEWSVASENPAGDKNKTIVYFYDQFDGYGGMNPTPHTEEVNEFAQLVTRDRPFNYPAQSNLEVDE
jgi:hypothetical protein